MKPILLLAFLALGPALADQLPLRSPASDPVASAVSEPAAADAAVPARDGEHLWLCGR